MLPKGGMKNKRTKVISMKAFKKAICEGRTRDVELFLHVGLKLRDSFVQCYDGISSGVDGGSPLHDAVKFGQLEVVQLLIDLGAKIHYIDPVTNETALHWAAKFGRLVILQVLASNGGSLLIKDGTASENTPIHTAAYHGQTDIIKWLVSRGVSVDAVNKIGLTPLLISVTRYTRLTESLIALRANVNCRSKDSEGMTPLHLAVRFSSEEMVFLLLKSRAQVRIFCYKYCYTPLHWTARLGMLAKLKIINNFYPYLHHQTNDNGESPVHLAAMFGHVNIMEWLFTKHSLLEEPNKRGYTPLHIAVIYKQYSIIDFLVQIGIGINLQKRTQNSFRHTALHIAAYLGSDSVVSLLLNSGADINAVDAKGLLPVHCAVKRNRVKCVEMLSTFSGAVIETNIVENMKLMAIASKSDASDSMRWLIQNGVLVNIQDSEKQSALHVSAFYGSLSTARILLENGANVNARNIKLFTPLHYSVFNGHYDVTILLLKFGADVNAECILGHNVAHFAAFRNHIRCLRFLISVGCKFNVNARNMKGYSPIHIAAFHDHIDIVSLLLEKGVPIDTPDYFRKTPLYYAILGGKQNVIDFLLQNNADVNFENDSKDQVTPLHKAAELGDIRLIQLLIAKGSSLDQATIQGETPLFYAVRNSNFDAAIELIKAGADVNAKDNLGFGMLQCEGFSDKLQSLLNPKI